MKAKIKCPNCDGLGGFGYGVSCGDCNGTGKIFCRRLTIDDPFTFVFSHHLQRQREWSEKIFGPGDRAQGIVDHIRKELKEIEKAPGDLEEWIDVAILALDGAWRSGASPSAIIAQLVAKQAKNETRSWPDWRTADPLKAIEHVRPENPFPKEIPPGYIPETTEPPHG